MYVASDEDVEKLRKWGKGARDREIADDFARWKKARDEKAADKAHERYVRHRSMAQELARRLTPSAVHLPKDTQYGERIPGKVGHDGFETVQ